MRRTLRSKGNESTRSPNSVDYQDVAAQPRRGPVEDWPQMDVDGLERAERLLDLSKRLVGADGCGIAENPFGQVGAQIGRAHV